MFLLFFLGCTAIFAPTCDDVTNKANECIAVAGGSVTGQAVCEGGEDPDEMSCAYDALSAMIEDGTCASGNTDEIARRICLCSDDSNCGSSGHDTGGNWDTGYWRR